jgi:hypothetical protein
MQKSNSKLKNSAVFAAALVAAAAFFSACVQGGGDIPTPQDDPSIPKYNISVQNQEGAGGQISVSSALAKAGSKITVNVSAYDGYWLPSANLAGVYELGGQKNAVNFSGGGGGYILYNARRGCYAFRGIYRG